MSTITTEVHTKLNQLNETLQTQKSKINELEKLIDIINTKINQHPQQKSQDVKLLKEEYRSLKTKLKQYIKAQEITTKEIEKHKMIKENFRSYCRECGYCKEIF